MCCPGRDFFHVGRGAQSLLYTLIIRLEGRSAGAMKIVSRTFLKPTFVAGSAIDYTLTTQH